MFKHKVLASPALTANQCLTGTELYNTSAGTQEVLINPELTAKPGRPSGGIGESKEYQHAYPPIRLAVLAGMLEGDAGLKGRNCSPLTWLSEAMVLC